MAVLISSKLIPQQLSMKLKNKSMHTYIKLQVTNVAVYVNTQLSEPYLSYPVKVFMLPATETSVLQ